MRSRKIYFNASVTLAAASMFLMRPSFFGESRNFFGSALFLSASLSAFMFGNVFRNKVVSLTFRIAPFILLWAYLLIHSQISGVLSPFPFYSFILCLMTSIGAVLLFSAEGASEKFVHLFILSLAALGLSSFVTFVLSLIVPIDSLHLVDIVSPTYRDKPIFFPLSIGYDRKFYPFATTYRFSMFWREAGIAQAIYCWALLVATRLESLQAKKWVIPSLIAGVAVTQSTIAYANLAIVLFAWAMLFSKSKLRIKILFVIALLPVSLFLVYFAIFDESIGLASKIDGASSLDRLYAVKNALAYLSDDLWGYGIYGNSGNVGANSGINLIGATAAIGLPGLLLVFFAWFCAVIFSDQRLFRFFSLLPIMITAITSQPLLDGFAIWIIFALPSISRRRTPV